ncbi:hypothetical protein MD484_g9076, partial [Candolleomyces efflorescens]
MHTLNTFSSPVEVRDTISASGLGRQCDISEAFQAAFSSDIPPAPQATLRGPKIPAAFPIPAHILRRQAPHYTLSTRADIPEPLQAEVVPSELRHFGKN